MHSASAYSRPASKSSTRSSATYLLFTCTFSNPVTSQNTICTTGNTVKHGQTVQTTANMLKWGKVLPSCKTATYKHTWHLPSGPRMRLSNVGSLDGRQVTAISPLIYFLCLCVSTVPHDKTWIVQLAGALLGNCCIWGEDMTPSQHIGKIIVQRYSLLCMCRLQLKLVRQLQLIGIGPKACW